MHDRRNTVELKHFMSENTGVASKPMKEIRRKEDEELITISDFNWTEPQSIRQVQEALENYRAILQLLWPMDQTGTIIGRLLLRYWFISAVQDAKTKVSVICKYFNAVQRLNVKRAANRSAILSYEEHEKVLKETLAANGLRSEVPYEGIHRVDRAEQGTSGPRANKPIKTKSNVSMVNGFRICYDYNNGKCTRKNHAVGCEDAKGTKYAHNCNVYVPEKMAGCHAKHPRTAHK